MDWVKLSAVPTGVSVGDFDSAGICLTDTIRQCRIYFAAVVDGNAGSEAVALVDHPNLRENVFYDRAGSVLVARPRLAFA